MQRRAIELKVWRAGRPDPKKQGLEQLDAYLGNIISGILDEDRPPPPPLADRRMVIGRHILIHTKDALAVLKKAVEMVRVGGLIAFQEYDLSWCPRGYPEMPLMFRTEEQIVEFFRRAVPRPNIGTQLFYLMQEAGLAPPECRAECIMDGGPHSPVYEWIAETVISLSARFQAVGMEPLANIDGPTLTKQLREEALRSAVWLWHQ